MKMIKFPSIEQFRTVVKNVKHQAEYVGQDENGEAIFNKNVSYPTLKFTGTVKLHGTNAGICYNSDEMWTQSRENIITPEKDNAGCAFFVESRKEVFKALFEYIRTYYNLDLTQNTIALFGEWCGGNIQKGVAITGLEKMFVIFGVKIVPNNEEIPAYWVNEDLPLLVSPQYQIHNINNFETYEISIDFNNPADIQNKLIELTDAVEEECPVGKYFGRVKGTDCTTGEGIVWTYTDENNQRHIFKVKGEKHSNSKVKTVAAVDTEKLNSIKEFVEYAVSENRLNQAIEQVFTQNSVEPDIKQMGSFLKWVANDIFKEEMDTLIDNKLEPKEIGGAVSTKARLWFINYLNSKI